MSRSAAAKDRGGRDDVIERAAEIEAPADPSRYRALQRMVDSDDYRLVVSLGGGAVPGLSGNCALLSVIEDLGLRPRVAQIWGTSAGAVVGGGWATGSSARAVLAEVEGLGRRRSWDVMWWSLFRALLARCLRRGCRVPDALVRGRHFHRAVAAGLRAATFEECEIEFRCIAATDGVRTERVVFRSGPLLPAISASMALPGVLHPLALDGSPTGGFLDGGLVEKTPLLSVIAEHAHGSDPRRLLVLGTHFGHDAADVDSTRGFLNRLVNTIDALESVIWRYQHREAAARSDVTTLVMDPGIGDRQVFRFARARRNFLVAREFFKTRLQDAYLALALAGP